MWVQLYEIASNIGTPLALAATTILLLFMLLRFVVLKLEDAIKRISGTQAFVLVPAVLTYGTFIAGMALASGVVLYGYKSLYETLADREELIRRGDLALNNQEGLQATRIGRQIVSGWGDEPDGYRILGGGQFLQGNFAEAALSFDRAANTVEGNVCVLGKRNMIANSAAALGMASDVDSALLAMDQIGGCDLEKGMVLNYSKLLIFSNRVEDGIDQIEKSDLLSNSRPDYRDRASFLLGTAYLMSDINDREFASADAFVQAACLNENFGRLFGSVTGSSTVDPPGSLLQSFDSELRVLGMSEFNSFRLETYDRIGKEC